MARGKQKNPTFVHVTIRVSANVNAYFMAYENKSEAMRTVLEDYVKTQGASGSPATQIDNRQLMLPV